MSADRGAFRFRPGQKTGELMSTALVEVSRPPYLMMAEQICLLLRQNGISAVLDSANAGSMLPHMGTAIGVRVFVPAEDAERARVLIDEKHPNEDGSSPWFCGHCRVDVDAGFETCWSCGGARAEVEQPFPTDREAAQSAVPADSVQLQAEALIARAWKISVISLGLAPMVGHLYSLALLFESTGLRAQVSPQSRQRFRRAMLLDFVALIAFGTFYSLILGLV